MSREILEKQNVSKMHAEIKYFIKFLKYFLLMLFLVSLTIFVVELFFIKQINVAYSFAYQCASFFAIIISSLLLCLSIFTLLLWFYVELKLFIMKKRLKKNGLKSSAKILQIQRIVGSRFFYIIDYELEMHHRNVHVLDVTYSLFNNLKLDDQVNILYDPKNIEYAVLDK